VAGDKAIKAVIGVERAPENGTTERFQFGWAGGIEERMADGFEEDRAVEVAVQETEVEEFGEAGVVRTGRCGHGRTVAGLEF